MSESMAKSKSESKATGAAPRAVVSAYAPQGARTAEAARSLAQAAQLERAGSLAKGVEIKYRHFHVWKRHEVEVTEEEDSGAYCDEGDEDYGDRFAGAQTHSGCFSGFITKKLTAADLKGARPDKSVACPAHGCSGKCFASGYDGEMDQDAFDNLDMDGLIKQSFGLRFLDDGIPPDDVQVNVCSKGHVWGEGSVSLTLVKSSPPRPRPTQHTAPTAPRRARRTAPRHTSPRPPIYLYAALPFNTIHHTPACAATWAGRLKAATSTEPALSTKSVTEIDVAYFQRDDRTNLPRRWSGRPTDLRGSVVVGSQ